jgi:hypothetical protein
MLPRRTADMAADLVSRTTYAVVDAEVVASAALVVAACVERGAANAVADIVERAASFVVQALRPVSAARIAATEEIVARAAVAAALRRPAGAAAGTVGCAVGNTGIAAVVAAGDQVGRAARVCWMQAGLPVTTAFVDERSATERRAAAAVRGVAAGGANGRCREAKRLGGQHAGRAKEVEDVIDVALCVGVTAFAEASVAGGCFVRIRQMGVAGVRFRCWSRRRGNWPNRKLAIDVGILRRLHQALDRPQQVGRYNDGGRRLSIRKADVCHRSRQGGGEDWREAAAVCVAGEGLAIGGRELDVSHALHRRTVVDRHRHRPVLAAAERHVHDRDAGAIDLAMKLCRVRRRVERLLVLKGEPG